MSEQPTPATPLVSARPLEPSIPDEWRKLVCCPSQLGFLAAIACGLSTLDAYEQAYGKENRKASKYDARTMLQVMKQRYPTVVKQAYAQRREVLALLAEDETITLLDSEDGRYKDSGIKHARAMGGLDAPTKVQIENPDLDRSKIVPEPPGSGGTMAERIAAALAGDKA